MEKILVLRPRMAIRDGKLEEMRKRILEEAKDGVAVIPYWVELVGIYDEVTIGGGCEEERVLRLIMESRVE